MSFFIITNKEYKNRILKLNLDGEAQKKAKDIFKDAYEDFSKYNEDISFNIDDKLSNYEYFYIDNFKLELDLNLVKSNPEAVTEFKNNSNIKLQDIVGIFTIKDDEILIQNFDKRNIIDLSRSFIWKSLFTGTDQFRTAESDGISFDKNLIAIISMSENNKIKFRSFYRLRRIFNMDNYFKEATEEEFNNFINKDHFFELSEDFDSNKIDDSEVRKKISIISHSDILNDKDFIKKLKDAAKTIKYNLPLNDSEDKILLSTNKKDFKKLLQFLSSNIYYDPITEKTRIATSSRIYE